jgi:2-isopropylmalate synthase
VLRAEGAAAGPWCLSELTTETRSGGHARAVVQLRHADGRSIERTASGDGPVDAAFKAIVLATGVSVTLSKFEVHAVTTGEDAQGEAVLYVEHNGRSYRGSSVSTDIVEASNRALLEVINRIELAQMSGRQAGDKRDESARLARLAQSAV